MRTLVPPLLAAPVFLLFLLHHGSAFAATLTQTDPVPTALPTSNDPPAAPAAPSAPAASTPPDAAADDDDETAPATPTFGAQGQWVFTTDLDLTFSTTSYANTEAKYHSYGVTPSVEWFISNNFSVGVLASCTLSGSSGYRNGRDLETSSTTGWALGARVGVNLPLSRALSLWLRGYFSYGSSVTHPELNGVADPTARDLKDSGANVSLSLPLLVHVAPHAFIGFGPWLTRTLGHSQSGYVRPTGDGTFLGAGVTLGGYL